MSEQISAGSELRKLHDHDPFLPFIVIMASGDRYPIDDPREMILSKDALTLVPLSGRGYSLLRLNQLSSIEVPEIP